MEWWRSLAILFLEKKYFNRDFTRVFWIYLDVEMMGDHVSEAGVLIVSTADESLQFIEGRYFSSG
jgi:hypothetical protein